MKIGDQELPVVSEIRSKINVSNAKLALQTFVTESLLRAMTRESRENHANTHGKQNWGWEAAILSTSQV